MEHKIAWEPAGAKPGYGLGRVLINPTLPMMQERHQWALEMRIDRLVAKMEPEAAVARLWEAGVPIDRKDLASAGEVLLETLDQALEASGNLSIDGPISPAEIRAQASGRETRQEMEDETLGDYLAALGR